jgi:predicted metalloprotease
MNSFVKSHWLRGAVFALGLGTMSNTVAFAMQSPPSPDVTEADVNASNAKVKQAYEALVEMWSRNFQSLGERFAPPAIMRYRGSVMTACGVMPANNALYCPQRNAIYFDDVFVAKQAKAAAQSLGTDGDMAAVGIIAHEMGHAAAMQLGETSSIPYENEAMADCLAGGFALASERNGQLEKGDLEEAFFGLAAAGDPTPQYTGNRRVDRQIAMRAQYLGHGTRDQRLANFNQGYKGGVGSCLSQ